MSLFSAVPAIALYRGQQQQQKKKKSTRTATRKKSIGDNREEEVTSEFYCLFPHSATTLSPQPMRMRVSCCLCKSIR
ncbi:hypothetical protein EYF80_020196 [Liparis tanakae]|uniref:Uncharacterized protein n=1 Tax=Liparis tanakae TaxID=230148 RepID=A0A4Z2HVE5_9TELE|nr:hypothetical protein EYF80_020196 [Liparis tanakae]